MEPITVKFEDIQRLAEKSLKKSVENNQGVYTFDPSIIALILEVVINLLKGCRQSPSEIKKACNGPAIMSRMLIRRELRKEGCPVDKRTECVDAILTMAQESLEEDIMFCKTMS